LAHGFSLIGKELTGSRFSIFRLVDRRKFAGRTAGLSYFRQNFRTLDTIFSDAFSLLRAKRYGGGARSRSTFDPANYSFQDFFSGVLVGAVEEGFAPASLDTAGFSLVADVAGDSFFAASLYESLL